MYFKIYKSKCHNIGREELNGSYILSTLYIQFQNPQTLFANINIPYFKDKVTDVEI